MGYIPHEQAIMQMKAASLLLMAIPDTPDNKGIVTGKFFEYLASRRPILAIGPLNGDIENMIRQCKAGRIFHYDETENMRLYILEIFTRFQKDEIWNETVETEKYTRRNLTNELAKNLQQLLFQK